MMTPLRLDIAKYRNAKGWTQEQLAERSGVHRVTIAKIESGQSANVGLDVIEKLADALGVKDPGKLVKRVDDD
jgi:transcriptional regulator with XRE-family HTH domain